ncbi:glutaminase [Microbacterium sulfonylureivorans]|uniref:glutaminase n=1 Tax=Microbacterium sulfonylureivorans TaxID=2486854 RepID=UPI000FD99270|nr:glutaminase [Microbacterium sulfonylureivorans]
MSIDALLDAARERLAGAPREGLGELVEPRRILGIARAARIVPRGTAWHLGALLLTDDGVLATGEVVRARTEAVRGYTAESQRRRSELAAAARRGGFDEGATVHIGWRMLDPAAVDRGEASDPLAVVDGVVSIRWSAAAGYMPLARYLDERIALLLDPPAGA